MTASNCLRTTLLGLIMAGGPILARAEGDVTIVPTSSPTTIPPAAKSLADNGTPPVHKSLHKKKSKASKKATASATGPGALTVPNGPSTADAPSSAKSPGAKSSSSRTTATAAANAKKMANISFAHTGGSALNPSQPPPLPAAPAIMEISRAGGVSFMPTPASSLGGSSALGPPVETGLPIARHSAMITMGGTMPVSSGAAYSSGMANPTSSYRSMMANPFPVSSAATGLYSPPPQRPSPSADFVFTNFNNKAKVSYPWKTNIFTTMFWIGESGSSISPTDNKASSWDAEWVSSNRGADNPYDRNGYAPADHAPTVNPFYIALPFNDLYCPDKAREWLPPGWHRPNGKDGKPVSACKDRWVEIKNAQGRLCYAQWEDVGPLRFDHAEYVFGSERPTTYTRAGLDVSPAVAQYLGIESSGTTSWRFVDDEDVPPGAWLKYDELAVVFKALHAQKNSGSSLDLPIEGAAQPTDDPESQDAIKKKIGAAKG